MRGIFLLLCLIAVYSMDRLAFFLPTDFDKDAPIQASLKSNALKFLDGITHYRIMPAIFREELKHHFDGLATVFRIEFQNGTLKTTYAPYKSQAYERFDECFYLGIGTTHLGVDPCLRNPAVNLLPLGDALWLTMDEVFWGKMNRKTLETEEAGWVFRLPGWVLNAHPACDRATGECFVQHPCGLLPNTTEVCVSLLSPGKYTMHTIEMGRTKVEGKRFMQHSHGTCITPNWVISKVDYFVKREADLPPPTPSGMLGKLHQKRGPEFVFYNRKTNETKIVVGNVDVINNHMLNCFEQNGNEVIVDVVGATESYLDNYYKTQLEKPLNWSHIMTLPQRCVANTDTAKMHCENFMDDESVIFDFPMWNPKYKMNPDYQWVYILSPKDLKTSRWMDRIIKLDMHKREIAKEWSAPGVYVTESTYIMRPDEKAEDGGVLLSVLFNSTEHNSYLAFFEASDLSLIEMVDLKNLLPFHTHGVNCYGDDCWSNP